MVAERVQLGRDSCERLDDAIDLRVPSVADNEDT